jgi:hypothetical protein
MTKINDHIDMLEVPLVAQTPVRVTLVNGSDFAVLAQIWDALCAKWGHRKEFRGLAMVMTHLDLLVASKSVARSATGTYRIA